MFRKYARSIHPSFPRHPTGPDQPQGRTDPPRQFVHFIQMWSMHVNLNFPPFEFYLSSEHASAVLTTNRGYDVTGHVTFRKIYVRMAYSYGPIGRVAWRSEFAGINSRSLGSCSAQILFPVRGLASCARLTATNRRGEFATHHETLLRGILT